jgi:aspartyl protease family protein
MTNEIGPWGSRTPEPPPPRRRMRFGGGRLWLWLCFAAALGALVAALAHVAPETVRTKEDWTWVGYRAGLVAVVAAALLHTGRGLRREHLSHAAAWALVLAALALGFAYRDELSGVSQHLQIAFSGGDPVATAAHELVVPQDEQGEFALIATVNGQRVRFLVDTGSSDTVLSPDDARRIGVDVDHLRYVKEAETANGVGYSAPFSAQRFEVGPIGVRDFGLTVNKAAMSSSLLGMSFLNRLESFEVKDHKLILRPRSG